MDKYIMESNENKHNKPVEYEDNSTLGWYDQTLNAAMWLSHGDVRPKNAACLLCGIVPDDNKVDPLSTSTDETTPNDFRNLLYTFEDVDRCDPKQRTLEQWRNIASSRDLIFHSWIDEYLKAKKISNPTKFTDLAEVKGVTKKVIQRVFSGLHFDYDHWGVNLADAPKWLIECRVSRGSRSGRVSHTWNPVLIGLALKDKGITKKQLNLAFMDLKDWKDEWQEKSDGM